MLGPLFLNMSESEPTLECCGFGNFAAQDEDSLGAYQPGDYQRRDHGFQDPLGYGGVKHPGILLHHSIAQAVEWGVQQTIRYRQ